MAVFGRLLCSGREMIRLERLNKSYRGGEAEFAVGPGAFVYTPRGVPHTFRLDGDTPARLLVLLTPGGGRWTLNLKNAEFTLDQGPIEENCQCPACRGFSRSYIRHLIKAGEILGLRLISLHNLHCYLNLMRRARAAIEAGRFAGFRKDFVENYRNQETADLTDEKG